MQSQSLFHELLGTQWNLHNVQSQTYIVAYTPSRPQRLISPLGALINIYIPVIIVSDKLLRTNTSQM